MTLTFDNPIKFRALDVAQFFEIFDKIDWRLKSSDNFLLCSAGKFETCQRTNGLHIITVYLWPSNFVPRLKNIRSKLNAEF